MGTGLLGKIQCPVLDMLSYRDTLDIPGETLNRQWNKSGVWETVLG